MLHSRAFLLLEKEFTEFKQANIFGISIMPMEDNWMEWIAEIEGLKDTLWEATLRCVDFNSQEFCAHILKLLRLTNNALMRAALHASDRQVKQAVDEIRAKCAELQLSLKYPEDYNTIPPTITFSTIPFHPNVDPDSGRPCVDFLDNPNEWNTNFTMTNILLSIQVLLSNPVLNNAVNLEAAQMLTSNYPLYREKVIQCVTNSKQLEAIARHWDTTSLEFYHTSKEQSEPHSPHRRITSISYEEYFVTWFKIATSRPAEDFKHPVFDDPEYIGNRYNWMAENVNKGYWDENLHQIFVSDCIEKQKKKLMLENWASNPMPRPTPASVSQKTPVRLKKKDKSKDEDQWEKEVEGLVMWSTNLDQEKLD